MHPSNRLRRALAVSACGGLTSALTWLPAGPAAASVASTFEAQTDASSQFTGTASASCDLTSGEDNVASTQALFSSGTRTRSVSLDATFTNNTDPSDVTRATGQFTGSMSVSEKHGDLTGFRLHGSGTASVSRAKGNASQCATDGFLGIQGSTEFTERRPGWLYVTRSTGPSAEAAMFATNERTKETVLFEEFVGGTSRETQRAFLTADTYNASELFVGIDSGNEAVARSSLARGGTVPSRMTGTFYRAGAAFGPTHGAGRRFVSFPGAVSCGRHSARLTFTSKADRLTAAAFSVNGHQVASVGRPKAGGRVVLRHLRGAADTRITARLSLDGGGRTSATRTYVPCQG